jgi:outer membrane protein
MRRIALLIACLGSFTGLPALADAPPLDFAAAYREALANDATFAAAQAGREAARYYVPQARAGLLPSIQISGNTAQNKSENTTPGTLGEPITRDYDYSSYSHQLQLVQPIWRPANMAQYRLAHAREAYAEAMYRKD